MSKRRTFVAFVVGLVLIGAATGSTATSQPKGTDTGQAATECGQDGRTDHACFLKTLGKMYCTVRHPVEAITTKRSACERQHIIQRQEWDDDDAGWFEDVDEDNVIWINAIEHDYADRSVDSPWDDGVDDIWWDAWGDYNIKRAYKMGVYANGYHFVVYDYKKNNGELTLFEWDGMSHLTYLIASWVNFITKELSYLGYQIERQSKGQQTQWLDAILGVVIDFVEQMIGTLYAVLGIAVGTIFNPWDTVTNVVAMVCYSIQSIVVGLWNTIADLISIVTLGWIELQTANW